MTIIFIHGVPTTRNKCTDGPDGYSCDVCREARRRYFQKGVDRRKALLAENPDIVAHGRVQTYRAWGCRCDACKRAATDARYQYGYTRNGVFHGRRNLAERRAKPFGRDGADGS